MPQNEYQIPSGEYSYIEIDTSVEFAKNNEAFKENEYNPNWAVSALDDVYSLYDNSSDKLTASEDIEDIQTSAYLHTIAEDIGGARCNHLDSVRTNRRATESIIRVLFNSDLSSKYNRISTEQELKNEEGKICADIFGPVESNETILFFNDNRESWFFYQEKIDSDNKRHSITLHYEVRANGVWRIDTKDGMKCEKISGQELENFVNSVKIYHQRVMSQIYKQHIKQNNKLAA